MSNKITDDDLNLSADTNDRLGDQGYAGQEYAAPVRGGAGVKAIFNPANRTRLIGFAAAAVLLGGGLAWTFLSVSEQEVLRGGSGRVQSSGVQTQANTKPSAIQREEAARYNDEVLPKEQESNPAAHPLILTDDGSVNPFDREAKFRSPTKVSDIGRREQKTDVASASPDVPVDYKNMDDLIRSLVEGEGSNTPSLYKVEWAYKGQKVDSSASGLDGGVADSPSVSNNSVCAKPATRAATMYMATADIALNSDVGGPVSLTIRNGKLRGSQLIGKFERKEEWLRMDLATLVTDDHTIQVSAIGLDMDTTLNAVQGDVNRHLMYRYGWWGVGTMLKAVGKAAEVNADSDIYVSDGAVVQSTTADSSRELKLALGSLGEDMGSAFQDRLNRPITVSLKVGDEVGVYFLNDVCLPAGPGDGY